MCSQKTRKVTVLQNRCFVVGTPNILVACSKESLAASTYSNRGSRIYNQLYMHPLHLQMREHHSMLKAFIYHMSFLLPSKKKSLPLWLVCGTESHRKVSFFYNRVYFSFMYYILKRIHHLETEQPHSYQEQPTEASETENQLKIPCDIFYNFNTSQINHVNSKTETSKHSMETIYKVRLYDR